MLLLEKGGVKNENYTVYFSPVNTDVICSRGLFISSTNQATNNLVYTNPASTNSIKDDSNIYT
jgi:hypothetical protein